MRGFPVLLCIFMGGSLNDFSVWTADGNLAKSDGVTVSSSRDAICFALLCLQRPGLAGSRHSP